MNLVNTEKVLEKLGAMSRSWLDLAMKRETDPFPQPSLRGRGKGSHRWEEHVVDQWIAREIARERANPPPPRPLHRGQLQRQAA